jgi:hypothetical protein
VPGGAKTVEEAKRAMRDPAVKDHYAAIDLKNLKQVTLTSDLEGYVSYRYGSQIFWTAKRIRLKAGETVYTDGQHIVRGRCLNCYSAHPMMPIRPNEPSEKAFNTPLEVPLIAMALPPPLPEAAPALPPPLEELTPTVPNVPGAPGHGGFPFIPIIPIIPPIHRHHNPPPPVTPVVPVVPPTSVVPEPNYVWGLGGVLVVFAGTQWIRARRQKPLRS